MSGFSLSANGPVTSSPDDPYTISFLKGDFMFQSDEIDNVTAGLVVPMTESFGSDIPDNFFDGSPLVFSKS